MTLVAAVSTRLVMADARIWSLLPFCNTIGSFLYTSFDVSEPSPTVPRTIDWRERRCSPSGSAAYFIMPYVSPRFQLREARAVCQVYAWALRCGGREGAGGWWWWWCGGGGHIKKHSTAVRNARIPSRRRRELRTNSAQRPRNERLEPEEPSRLARRPSRPYDCSNAAALSAVTWCCHCGLVLYAAARRGSCSSSGEGRGWRRVAVPSALLPTRDRRPAAAGSRHEAWAPDRRTAAPWQRSMMAARLPAARSC